MKNFKVKYSGSASRFKNFEYETSANSEREAVESVYKQFLDDNYFPQDDGSIKDCDGEVVSLPGEPSIDHGDGSFYAEEIVNTYDVHFNSETSSNSKGFSETLEYCKDYIKDFNGTNESYFKDYKRGTVSVVCNETGEEVYVESVK